ncbi:MAG: hypothetical protein WCO11_04140 [Sphingomonadales bacterium]|jgi:hypothetical protein
MTALALGLRYFAGVFAIAFALGTVRTLWLAPVIGAMAAVAIEVPILWRVSWWWGRRLLVRQPVALGGRVVMGGTAFGWLMLAELALSLAFGRTAGEHLALMLAPAGLLGLAGQLGFAVIPLLIGGRQP